MRVHCSSIKQNGYALLLLMFFLALLVVSLAAAVPNMLTSGRREKEREMIWRGQQYVRAIRLYHRKTNQFPLKLEDLYMPKTGIRFMRQAYKDPMNSIDGSWRLIYVGPNGELIGSLNEHRNAFFFGAPPQAGYAGALAPNTPTAPPTPAPIKFQDPFALPEANDTSFNSLTSPFQANESPGTSGQTANADSASSVSDAKVSAAPVDDGQRFGQTLVIGVGSKINKSSIGMYGKAKNYLQFEFIWDGTDLSAGGLLSASSAPSQK